MDLELKEFEEKINSITEKFISLIDSDDTKTYPTENKFEGIVNTCETGTVAGPTVYNTNYGTNGFELGTDGIEIGGIAYANSTYSNDAIPNHAVKFDSVEQMNINQKLESLYIDKKCEPKIAFEKPSVAFSDANLRRANSTGYYNIQNNYDKNEANSTIKNKEVYTMANYSGEEKTGNVFFDYATIPAEQALVEKKDWKEVLFADIPWDTKIDIWGGIKKFCTTKVKFTFD